MEYWKARCYEANNHADEVFKFIKDV